MGYKCMLSWLWKLRNLHSSMIRWISGLQDLLNVLTIWSTVSQSRRLSEVVCATYAFRVFWRGVRRRGVFFRTDVMKGSWVIVEFKSDIDFVEIKESQCLLYERRSI